MRKYENERGRNYSKRSICRIMVFLMALCVCCGCGSVPTYEEFDTSVPKMESLLQVSDCFVPSDYETRHSLIAQTEVTYTSNNGLCVIQDMGSYYDVMLDYENGTPKEVGNAYGECLLQIADIDMDFLEEYVYENIHMAFPDLTEDYSPVWERVEDLFENMPKEYLDELLSLAKTVSGGECGMVRDGKLSYEELCIGNLVPDVLRGTSCFGLSVWGEKTKQGERYNARILEWFVGSEKQTTKMHAVIHAKNGEKSFTSIAFLGILDVLTAVNDKGVMIACLDVRDDDVYNSKGKIAYSWAFRYAMENYDTADEVADFLLSHAGEYSYNPNVLLGDAKHSYCVELCNEPEKALAVLRTKDSQLGGNLTWSVPDSLCIINDYVVKGTGEDMPIDSANYNRWRNMERWLLEKDKMDLADMKEILTKENLLRSETEGEGDTAMLPVGIFSRNMIHIAIVDYHTGDIHVAFAGEDGIQNRPDFYVVGNYKEKLR